MYTLGLSYSAGERTDITPYGPKSLKSVRSLNGSWLRGVKGCFVRGKDHIANENHKRGKYHTQFKKKLKEMHVTAVVTVSELDVLFDMGREDAEENGDPYQAKWAEEDDGDPEKKKETVGHGLCYR